MEPVDNNQFEVVPAKSKRKIVPPCPNVYLNPALDLLANEDPMCNTAMEIVPVKKRKRSRSCDIIAFENTALDLGISKIAVNEFLARELDNVRKNIRSDCSNVSANVSGINVPKTSVSEPNIKTFDLNTSVDSTVEEFKLKSNGVRNVHHFEASQSCTMNLHSQVNVEPVYANLPEVVPRDNTVDVSMATKAFLDTQNAVNTDSYLPKTEEQSATINFTPQETDVTQSVLPVGMEVSKLDKTEADSGISIIDQKSTIADLENNDLSAINTTNIQTNITNQVFINNPNLSLSFIDRLALDSPNISNQSLILDDDLNESNIMEIKTITIITKKKRIVPDKRQNTNPFLDPNFIQKLDETMDETSSSVTNNPFLSTIEAPAELEYNQEIISRPVQDPIVPVNPLMPRRLFADNNSTISTVNDTIDQHEYENIDGYRSESPVYENVGEMCENYNKQSKVLGHDVSQFSSSDIMNRNTQGNNSNDSNDSKRDLKHHILKASNKLSKKVLKKLKKTFKADKSTTVEHNSTLNPYEIPRKPSKDKTLMPQGSGIENPALNLDTSDIEIEELDEFDEDEEHQYETIKTLRNTRLNMNVTPLKERTFDNVDISHNKTTTPGKKVRFDSTLNQEKVITGNSFDYGLQSPGFDAKIDKYHDELENCINERKILQQNM